MVRIVRSGLRSGLNFYRGAPWRENGLGYQAAAKFVNGPDDPESPGNEDSAFGAVIPEPTTAMLLGTGLLLLSLRRR